jgi:signal transduction histidine kinase
MKYWFRGQRGGITAFLAIAALVTGGLGWATKAALRLEREQQEQKAQTALYDKLRLALWRLDTLVAPALAREDSRPYYHYSALYVPAAALHRDGSSWEAGSVLEPSPLLSADLPDWMPLHFRIDREQGCRSPQVLSPLLAQRLHDVKPRIPLANVTPRRRQLLGELSKQLSIDTLLASLRAHPAPSASEDVAALLDPNASLPPSSQSNSNVANTDAQGLPAQQALSPDREYLNRLNRNTQMKSSGSPSPQGHDVILGELEVEDGAFFRNEGKSTQSKQKVTQGSMVPLWLAMNDHSKQLAVARLVRVGDRDICQGVFLDWPRLQALLAQEVSDLFLHAQIQAIDAEAPLHSERTMTALPLQLEPGETVAPAPQPMWTPLRVGLASAWLAALVALAAVGLGGWSLIDLSQRRIRFVAAVTHELRTPLTTLRLYLDMLTSGLVKNEEQKDEYLHTLNTEAERLNRLVANVLDFSRLEDQRPKLVKSEIAISDLLSQVFASWQSRCLSAGKELVIENTVPSDLVASSDWQMVQQTLGNLIDNACKYSQGVADKRIWLRAHGEGKRLIFEVEDAGPGVVARERRLVFRAFRRGQALNATAGGVGLGLALARHWANLLGGRLGYRSGSNSGGACFCLELPLSQSR